MSEAGDIPTLTDLIESGDRIDIADLGLDEELGFNSDDPATDDTIIDVTGVDLEIADPAAVDPALEQAILRIFDKHMEQARQEIRLLLQRELKK